MFNLLENLKNYLLVVQLISYLITKKLKSLQQHLLIIRLTEANLRLISIDSILPLLFPLSFSSILFFALSNYFNNFDTTGKYTVQYKLEGNEGSVKPEFFYYGNEAMRTKYNGKFPWRKE